MKKWIVRIVITLLALFLLIGLIPFSEEIHYSGTGYEFSLASDGTVAEHEIRIDGTYSSILFLKFRSLQHIICVLHYKQTTIGRLCYENEERFQSGLYCHQSFRCET